MKSSYKRLGDFIHKVESRNRDLKVNKLVGLSMTKEFRVSTSNVVGTDMSVYKIVNKWQFSCDFMSVIRVHKFPVVLKVDEEPVLVSPAYTVFEVNDNEVLYPQYLMMWFRRSEFDRYADFKCDSAIRGGFDWDALCDCYLPIPSIEKQREIVREYHVIQNRIALNNQLITKLEETAQAIYKQWFVDFEFPDENGLPYKSNDGEMKWCDKLEKEIPEDWKTGFLSELIEFKNGKSKPIKNGLYPVYGGNGIIDFVSNYNFEDIIAIGRVGAYCGSLFRVKGKCWISDNAISAISKQTNNNMFCFELLKSLKLNERSEGTGQPLLTQAILNSIEIIIPNSIVINLFEKHTNILFNQLCIKQKEKAILIELKDLLLARMTRVETKTILV